MIWIPWSNVTDCSRRRGIARCRTRSPLAVVASDSSSVRQRRHCQCDREPVSGSRAALAARPVADRAVAGVARRLCFPRRTRRAFLRGAAGNVKLHVLNYFRIDQATSRALEYAHRTTNITWRATRGMVGAQLHAAALDGVLFASAAGTSSSASFTWQLSPDAIPGVAVVPLSAHPHTTETFGLSRPSARHAMHWFGSRRNTVYAIACWASPGSPKPPAWLARLISGRRLRREVSRKKQLMRLFAALRPLRVPTWPHRGPVGIRERSDIHVVDHWQFLGRAN